MREVGAALGASEDAAQKRVSRAIEQLRAFFLRRGIVVTAAGLATDISVTAPSLQSKDPTWLRENTVFIARWLRCN